MDVRSVKFKIFTLPRSHPDQTTWKILADKYKTFRLNSLRASPEAFSSTFAIESKFVDSVWLSRLNNPLASHVVALSSADTTRNTNSDGKSLSNVVEGEWLGAGVLIGPKDDGHEGVHASRSPWSNIDLTAESPDAKQGLKKPVPLYQINGLYVVPNARELGIGKAIIDALLESGRRTERLRNGSKILLQVRVESRNEAAKKLYQKSGFTASNQETVMMKEKEKDGVLIPAHQVTVIVMERQEDL